MKAAIVDLPPGAVEVGEASNCVEGAAHDAVLASFLVDEQDGHDVLGAGLEQRDRGPHAEWRGS